MNVLKYSLLTQTVFHAYSCWSQASPKQHSKALISLEPTIQVVLVYFQSNFEKFSQYPRKQRWGGTRRQQRCVYFHAVYMFGFNSTLKLRPRSQNQYHHEFRHWRNNLKMWALWPEHLKWPQWVTGNMEWSLLIGAARDPISRNNNSGWR